MSRARRRNEATAPIFAALGCVTRLELLSRLGDGRDHSITELTEGLDLTRQAVTKHLEVMRDAGIVKRRRVGRESRFTLRPASFTRAKDYLARVSDQWDEAVERLRSAVER